jgi:hypothetical protein
VALCFSAPCCSRRREPETAHAPRPAFHHSSGEVVSHSPRPRVTSLNLPAARVTMRDRGDLLARCRRGTGYMRERLAAGSPGRASLVHRRQPESREFLLIEHPGDVVERRGSRDVIHRPHINGSDSMRTGLAGLDRLAEGGYARHPKCRNLVGWRDRRARVGVQDSSLLYRRLVSPTRVPKGSERSRPLQDWNEKKFSRRSSLETATQCVELHDHPCARSESGHPG